MATFLLPALRRPLLTTLTVGLGGFAFIGVQSMTTQIRRPLLCDSYASYSRDTKVPVVKQGRVNPAAFRQISTGSILGLAGGLAVSTFSKSLAFLIGLFVLAVQVCLIYLNPISLLITSRQTAAYKGYNIVPTTRLQKYVKSIDLRSAVQDNVAFKFSFGTTFLLAAFADFN